LTRPGDFDTHEDAFLNLMLQMLGVLKEPLDDYVVHPTTMPTAFSSDKEEWMYQFPLEGSAFQMDEQPDSLPKGAYKLC
jgi:hypothetical protein